MDLFGLNCCQQSIELLNTNFLMQFSMIFSILLPTVNKRSGENILVNCKINCIDLLGFAFLGWEHTWRFCDDRFFYRPNSSGTYVSIVAHTHGDFVTIVFFTDQTAVALMFLLLRTHMALL